jgi:hypothetical protein
MRRIPVLETQVSMYVRHMGYCVQPYMASISLKQKFCPSQLFHYLTQSMRMCPHYESSQVQRPKWSTKAQRFIPNDCLFLTISQPNNYTLTHSWKRKTKRQTSLMPTTGVRHGWIISVSHRCFMTHLSTIRVNADFPNTSWSSQRPLSKMPNLSASTIRAATQRQWLSYLLLFWYVTNLTHNFLIIYLFI